MLTRVFLRVLDSYAMLTYPFKVHYSAFWLLYFYSFMKTFIRKWDSHDRWRALGGLKRASLA